MQMKSIFESFNFNRCFVQAEILSISQNPSVLDLISLKNAENELIHPLEKVETQV